MNNEKTSWGGVADWYDSLVSDPDSYQQAVILPNFLRLLNLKAGDKVLDVACGQGIFAKNFAERGAFVTGIDISRELIALAKNKAGKRENYFVAPAEEILEVTKPEDFNIATIILALQNIEDINKTLFGIARTLKVGGKLFIVLNHPAFRIPKESSWGFDEEKKVQYRRLDGYLSESKVEIEMHPGQNKNEKTISFHRPLQLYFKALTKAGFVITRLEEWNSHRKSEAGPRQKAEDKARKEIPLFLMIEAQKQNIPQ